MSACITTALCHADAVNASDSLSAWRCQIVGLARIYHSHNNNNKQWS